MIFSSMYKPLPYLNLITYDFSLAFRVQVLPEISLFDLGLLLLIDSYSGFHRVVGELPVMLDSLAFEGFHLQEVEQTVLILHEVTHELGNVSKFLNLQEILTEKSEKVTRHKRGLLDGARSTTHH